MIKSYEIEEITTAFAQQAPLFLCMWEDRNERTIAEAG